MATVKYVKDNGEGRIILAVYEGEEGVKYSVSRSLYSSIGMPCRDYELSEAQLRAVIEDDEDFRAMKKALSVLAFSDKNRRALYIKLRQCGFSDRSVTLAVKECVALGYIDEDRQLMRLISTEANISLRGPLYIRNKLRAKGYSTDAIEQVWRELVDEGEIHPQENLRKLYEKKKALTEEEKRIIRYKYGYGSFD